MATVPIRLPWEIITLFSRRSGRGAGPLTPVDVGIGFQLGPMFPVGKSFVVPSLGGGYGALISGDERAYGPRARAQVSFLLRIGDPLYAEIVVGTEWMWNQSGRSSDGASNVVPMLDIGIGLRGLFEQKKR
jgi:hypothetical protein